MLSRETRADVSLDTEAVSPLRRRRTDAPLASTGSQATLSPAILIRHLTSGNPYANESPNLFKL